MQEILLRIRATLLSTSERHFLYAPLDDLAIAARDWSMSSTMMQKSLLLLLIFVISSHCFRQGHFHNRFVSHSESRALTKRYLSSPISIRDSKTDIDAIDSSGNGDSMKLGVLLLNLGGPEKMKDVEGFLFNLFADPDIIRLPPLLSILQKPIAYVIAKRRAPKSSEAYESIGGGSPIVKYTQAQASKIESILTGKGYDAKCYFAMRYWNPYTEEVLDQMKRDNVNTIVIVPLYPQFSISTSGSSLKLLQEIFYKEPEKWGPDKVTHTVVPSWYFRPGYVKTMAKLILDELRQYSHDDMKEGVHVLFSAHGVPQSYIEAGDPYQRQIEECVGLISKEIALILDSNERPSTISEIDAKSLIGANHEHSNIVKPLKIHLSFQSRVGPVQWLKPYTEEMLENLGHSGVKNLIVVPVSFVSEHIETLEEIDMEYKELAYECGIKNWRRVPALNTDQSFIDDMAKLVVDALESPAMSLTESAAQEMEGSKGDRSLLFGLSSNTAEVINGRLAMLGIVGTSLIELFGGHPIISIVGMR